MQKSKRYPFTDQENRIIRETVKRIGEDWEAISRKLPGRTPKQCHDRYINYLREGLKSGPWSSQEDDILINMYKAIGPKWSKMMVNLPGRSGNDIKNRWYKHLIKKSNQTVKINNINNSKISYDDQTYQFPSLSKVHKQKLIKKISLDEAEKPPIVRISPNDFTVEVLPRFLGIDEQNINNNRQQQIIPLQQQIQEELRHMEFEMAFELEMSQF